uniref:Cytochrome P450 85A2 n=1 Tax=Aegilops tauschii TaxID=37682 RepID=R7W9Y4_AEGTA
MSLLLVLISVVVGMVGLLLRWNEVRYGRRGNVRLPPGTMGWPLFGETTEFLKEGPSFMKRKGLRYGRLFRTHILGCPTVACMDPELNRRMLLQGESGGLVPGYSQYLRDIDPRQPPSQDRRLHALPPRWMVRLCRRRPGKDQGG